MFKYTLTHKINQITDQPLTDNRLHQIHLTCFPPKKQTHIEVRFSLEMTDTI